MNMEASSSFIACYFGKNIDRYKFIKSKNFSCFLNYLKELGLEFFKDLHILSRLNLPFSSSESFLIDFIKSQTAYEIFLFQLGKLLLHNIKSHQQTHLDDMVLLKPHFHRECPTCPLHAQFLNSESDVGIRDFLS